MTMTMKTNNSDGKRSSFKRQRGVGLIEVLIAVFVFTLGMLSLAGMQLAAKRANYEATQRSIATGLARDLLERMRGNPEQLALFVADNIADPNSPLAAAATNCAAADCTPAQLAAYDLVDWESLVLGSTEKLGTDNAGGLVSPRACITNVDGIVTVAIAWLGVSNADNPGDSACGNGVVGLYDDPDQAEGNNLRRRLLVMSTFIGES